MRHTVVSEARRLQMAVEQGMATTSETSESELMRDALAERLMQATRGMFDIFTTYLGDRLGLYGTLARTGLVYRRRTGAPGWHPRAVRARVARAADGHRHARASTTRR